MEWVKNLCKALGLSEDTDAQKALALAKAHTEAGDEGWMDKLSDEDVTAVLGELDKQKADSEAAARREKLRGAITVGKTGDERKLEDKLRAAEAETKQEAERRAAAASRDLEPQFSTKDTKSALADIGRRAKQHLAGLHVPKSFTAGATNEQRLTDADILQRFPAGGNEVVAAFQEFCDTAYGIAVMQTEKGHRPDPTKTAYWRDHAEVMEQYKAMYSTSTGYGDEWVPTGWSSRLIDLVRISAPLFNSHPHFPMPTNPYINPMAGTDPTVYLQGEATLDEATKYRASTPGTAQKSFTAKLFAVRILTSGEFEEDSIIPVLPQLEAQTAIAFADGLDDAMLNGQTTNFDTGDVNAADDVRSAWNGYRYYVTQSVTDAAVNCATFSVDNLAKIPAAMGKYAQRESDLMWVCSIKTHYGKLLVLKDSNNNPVVMADGQAPGMTPISRLFGIPIVRSGLLSNELSGSGIYDNSSTGQGAMLLVYKPAFMIGDRRDLRSAREFDIQTGQWILVSTGRWACTNVYSASSNPTVGMAYNFRF